MQNRLLSVVEESSMKPSVPKFDIGDTVDVHVRILEGDKERIQIYNGVVIARSGSGTREMFVVRRIVQGEGVERKFPIHSPRIADIVVKRSGKVRRAKLYYLRERSGKSVRLKERFTSERRRHRGQGRRQGRAEGRQGRHQESQGRGHRRGQGQVITRSPLPEHGMSRPPEVAGCTLRVLTSLKASEGLYKSWNQSPSLALQACESITFACASGL